MHYMHILFHLRVFESYYFFYFKKHSTFNSWCVGYRFQRSFLMLFALSQVNFWCRFDLATIISLCVILIHLNAEFETIYLVSDIFFFQLWALETGAKLEEIMSAGLFQIVFKNIRLHLHNHSFHLDYVIVIRLI